MIRDQINIYLNTNLNKIDNWIKCITLKFNDNEYKKWRKLCLSYEKTREKLINLKN